MRNHVVFRSCFCLETLTIRDTDFIFLWFRSWQAFNDLRFRLCSGQFICLIDLRDWRCFVWKSIGYTDLILENGNIFFDAISLDLCILWYVKNTVLDTIGLDEERKLIQQP